MNKYGNQVIGTFSDGQLMASASFVTSSAVEMKGASGDVEIGIWANTDFEVNTTGSFEIEIQVSEDNVTYTTLYGSDEAHTYVVRNTATDGAISWSAGDRIGAYIIPRNDFVDKRYYKLLYTTIDDASAIKVDAIMYTNA